MEPKGQTMKLLDAEIEAAQNNGYALYCKGTGIISTNKYSNICKALKACLLETRAAVAVSVIGAKAGRSPHNGYQWAVMYHMTDKNGWYHLGTEPALAASLTEGTDLAYLHKP
jgi:hypothetical protein